MRAAGFGIRRADQIGGRHLKAFVAARLRDGISARTLANQMSHLRAVLEHTGKSGLARNPEFSNRALGIGQGSRIGTKAVLSDRSLSAFRERMAEAVGRASASRWRCSVPSACANPRPSAAAARTPGRWQTGAS